MNVFQQINYCVTFQICIYKKDDVHIYELESSLSGNDDDGISCTDDLDDDGEGGSLDDQWRDGTSEERYATTDEDGDEGNCLI